MRLSHLKARQRIRSAFVPNPLGDLAKLVVELDALKLKLLIFRGGEPLDTIVPFFDAVSKWDDRVRELEDLIARFKRVNYGQHQKVIDHLIGLKGLFVGAGRMPSGWNRTKDGEAVTEENVYLGDIYGLFTHPVSHWKRELRDDEPLGAWRGGMWDIEYTRTHNTRQVISNQARNFMQPRIEGMIRVIDQLGEAAEPYMKKAA